MVRETEERILVTIPEFLILAAMSDLEKRTGGEILEKINKFISESSLIWPALASLTHSQFVEVFKEDIGEFNHKIFYRILTMGVRAYERQRGFLVEALRKL